MLLKVTGYTLDPDRFELLVGGKPVPMRTKVFKLLYYLVKHHERVVSREELMASIWPNQIVEETTLSASIKLARKAVGDDGRAQKVIKTIHNQGYRCIAPVTVVIKEELEHATPEGYAPDQSGEQQHPSLVQIVNSRPKQFIGRERELVVLDNALNEALAGNGQIRFVTGSAGRGKTMLLQEFAHHAMAAERKLLVVTGCCDQNTQQIDPYLPFRRILEMSMACAQEKTLTADHGARIISALPYTTLQLCEFGLSLVGTFLRARPLLNSLESVLPSTQISYQHIAEYADSENLSKLNPKKIIALYSELMTAIAKRYPLLVVVEDLHWADPSSCALLESLSQQIVDSPILIVCSLRSDGVSWAQESGKRTVDILMKEMARRYRQAIVDLDGVSPQIEEAFCNRYLDLLPNNFDACFRETFYRHTQGYPLFVAELLQDMQLRGDVFQGDNGVWQTRGDVNWSTLPAKTEGVIAMSLARLSDEQVDMLRIAAVQGEVFDAEVVARVKNIELRSVVDTLSRQISKVFKLVQAEGVALSESGTLSKYRFRHNLFQQYLYNQLDSVEKTFYHEEVAEALEHLYVNDFGSIVAQLAQHYACAQAYLKSAKYYQQAGVEAFKYSANLEAEEQFIQGLKLIERVPKGAERLPVELSLRGGYAGALLGAKGFFDTSVENAVGQAACLAEEVGPTEKTLPLYFTLVAFYFNTRRHQKALAFAGKMLKPAQQSGQDHHLVLANTVLGLTLFNIESLDDSLPHFKYAAEAYRPAMHSLIVKTYNLDMAACSPCFLSLVMLLRGYPETAFRILPGPDYLETLKQPATIANVAIIIGRIYALSGRLEETEKMTDYARKIAHEHGLHFYMAYSEFVYGWAIGMQGQLTGALMSIDTAREIVAASGGTMLQNMTDAMSAAVLFKAGRREEAISILDDSEHEQHYDVLLPYYLIEKAQVYRYVQAEKAEQLLRRAISETQPRNSRWFELQAAVDLAVLLHDDNRNEEAMSVLNSMFMNMDGLDEIQRTETYQRGKTLYQLLNR